LTLVKIITNYYKGRSGERPGRWEKRDFEKHGPRFLGFRDLFLSELKPPKRKNIELWPWETESSFKLGTHQNNV